MVLAALDVVIVRMSYLSSYLQSKIKCYEVISRNVIKCYNVLPFRRTYLANSKTAQMYRFG
jgi:hypothetical protein